MSYAKQARRLLGLLAVAVLAVMAFAASAQAGFLINKKPALAAVVGGVIDPGTVGTMLVPGLNFQLSCTALTVDEGNISTTIDAKAVILYTGCTTLDFTTKKEIPCEVVEPIKAVSLNLPTQLADGKPAILVENIKALIKLTKVGDLFKPCTLPEDNTITGTFCFKVTDASNDTVQPLIEAPATCGTGSDVVKYGSQIVTLDSKAVLELVGEHKGLTLGVS